MLTFESDFSDISLDEDAAAARSPRQSPPSAAAGDISRPWECGDVIPVHLREPLHERDCLCVVESTTGDIAPISARISSDDIRIRWSNYRGYRASPFKDPPNKLKRAISKWREGMQREPTAVPEDAQAAGVCYVCGVRFSCSPREHMESDEHRRSADAVCWDELDSLKRELDAEFFSQLNGSENE